MSTPSAFRRRRTRRRWGAGLVVVVAGALTLTGTAGPALEAGDSAVSVFTADGKFRKRLITGAH